MKNWIIVAAFASAILASCTKNEVRVDMPDQAISFTTAVGANSTKAMINGTAYPHDPAVSFGTYAYYLPSDQRWPDNAGNAKLYIPESEVRYTENIENEDYDWTTTTPYYWPSAGSLTFFSFSPWSINTSVECSTTNGIKITGWDVDANQKVDVMVADVAANKTANEANGVYKGVPTVFRHKLSQIVAFKFNTDKDYTNAHDGTTVAWAAGDKQIVVTGISIDNIATKGTFISGPNPDGTNLGTWSVDDPATVKTYTWYKDATGTTIKSSYTAVDPNQTPATNGYLLVLPQTFGDTETITLKYTIKTYNGTDWVDDNVTKTIKLKDIHAAPGAATGSEAFEMNKKITYNFTIGLNQIYWAPSVVDWETESHDVTVPVA